MYISLPNAVHDHMYEQKCLAIALFTLSFDVLRMYMCGYILSQHVVRQYILCSRLPVRCTTFCITMRHYSVSLFLNKLLLLSYLLIRGIIDPIRRSDSILWWRKYPLSVILAPICALIIDLTIIYTRIKTAVIKK